MLLGIADFGRLYASTVAVEAAAREAADFGAFDASYWTDANVGVTVNEMQRRACVAASGSHLEGYETTDPVDNATCTNPTFSCSLERNGASTDCGSSHGFTNGIDCSLIPPPELPCTVHVTLQYEFRTLLGLPPIPASIQVVRQSWFRISNLEPPAP